MSLKQLLDFLCVNQSKSEASEGSISIMTWLAKRLGIEVDSVRLELQVSIQVKEGCSNREESDVIDTLFMITFSSFK